MLMYDTIINKYAFKYNIDPLLIKAIIKVESNFDPYALRKEYKKNKYIGISVGFGQILYPSTAKNLAQKYFQNEDITIEKLFDPETNIRYMTCLLAELQKRYKNDIKKIISAYNAGEPTKKNKNYVNNVLNVYSALKTNPSLYIFFLV